jgi:pimeloyl-ACP methyl ester carboxylesterase
MAQERFVGMAGGLRLHLLSWPAAPGGAPNAAPTLLLHGLASNAQIWEPVAARLAAAGHPVFAADLRGHGLSDKPDQGYDLATFADDIAGLVEALELDRPVVVGQSLGAFAIVEAFARRPDFGRHVRGVVLVEGGLVDASVQFASLDECLAGVALPPVTGVPAARLEGYFRHTYPDWADDRVAAAMASMEVRPDGIVAGWRLGPERVEMLARSMWEWRAAPLLPAVAVPTLWIVSDTGDAAWTAAKRKAAAAAGAAMLRARIRWLVAEHDVHADRPDEVAAMIAGFIDDGFAG